MERRKAPRTFGAMPIALGAGEGSELRQPLRICQCRIYLEENISRIRL